MKKLLVPVFTLAAGFAGGWYFQRRPAPAPGTPSAGSSVTVAEAVPGTPAVPDKTSAAVPDKLIPGKPGMLQGSLQVCRDIFKAEKNPSRAMVKTMTLLDSMDAVSIAALAREVSESSGGWSDSQASMLMPLVFGKLAEMDAPAAMKTAMESKDMWSRMAAAGAVVEQLARSNPAAAAEAIDKLPPGYLRRSVLASAASAIARSDGPAAVAMLQRAKVPPNDWTWSRMLGAWAGRDPAGASAQLLTLPRQTVLNSMDSITTTWARRDPAGAMSWAQSLTDPALRRSALSGSITAIAQNDPQHAIALASAQPAGDRRLLMTGIASSFGQADGPGAVAWAKGLADPQERQRCLCAVAESVGYGDTNTARAAVELLPPGALRNGALSDLGRRMSWTDPVAARDWALTLKPNEQALVMDQVVFNLAGVDIAAAEKLTDSLPPSGDNQAVWASIAGHKALQDPAAALTWAGTLDTEQARVAASNAAFERWASHSPDKAAAAVAGIVDANLRRQAAESVAAAWAGQSPAEAMQWAGTLSGEDRIAALSAVWNTSASDDPRAAGQSLAKAAEAAAIGATSTDKLAGSASTIASAWAGQSPTDAAAWAVSLPDGKIREQALGQVASEWARYDPTAVSEWINNLPHDRSRDAAIGQLVGRIVKTDPESAFTWAASVENSEQQAETLKSTALAWKAINPEAARAAVQNANLPESVVARLEEALR